MTPPKQIFLKHEDWLDTTPLMHVWMLQRLVSVQLEPCFRKGTTPKAPQSATPKLIGNTGQPTVSGGQTRVEVVVGRSRPAVQGIGKQRLAGSQGRTSPLAQTATMHDSRTAALLKHEYVLQVRASKYF
jgi:hypothetical protein